MLETYPDKISYTLVDFWSGIPETHNRYTNLSKDSDVLGAEWQSLTTLGIELPEESFELATSPAEIVLPKQSWMTEYFEGFIVPKTNVQITQVFEWFGSQFGTARLIGTWSLSGTVTDQGGGRYRIQNGSIRQDGVIEPGYRFRLTYTIVSATNFVVLENGTENTPLINVPGTHYLDFIAKAHDIVIKTTVASDVVIEAISCVQKFYDQVRETQVLFLGSVLKFVANYNGETGVVKVVCAHIKDELDVELGIIGSSNCPWVFGGAACKKNLVPLRETGVISSIDGLTVTLTGLTTTSNAYWENGYIERSGLRARIRAHGTGSVMETERVLPPSWVGATVTLTPGCDKSTDDCDTKWSNIANFGGFAVASPAYDPRAEVA